MSEAEVPQEHFHGGSRHMNSQLVIDAIVRQSMVLIAQLATVHGVRSPVSHIADEVFISLVRELESQGLGKPAIAGMFGLALRAYRQKVQRLTESVTRRGVTLWGAVHAFLTEHDSASQTELLEHFEHDEASAVRRILDDLVDGGLVRRTGPGPERRYRVATAEELEELGTSAAAESHATNEALVWVLVCRAGPIRKDQLAELSTLTPAILDQALDSLVADERVRVEGRADGAYYATDRCLIPVGEAAGWEAALVDHHRAVLTALAAKAVSGRHVSAADDEVGGTTLSYDLWPGHPKEREVRELLAETRQRIIALWNEVEEHNRGKSADVNYRVTFYCGQHLMAEE